MDWRPVHARRSEDYPEMVFKQSVNLTRYVTSIISIICARITVIVETVMNLRCVLDHPSDSNSYSGCRLCRNLVYS